MELHEFHVRHPAARPPRHGDAVAGGAVRIAGVQIDPARAAGGQHHETGGDHLDPTALAVQDVSAQAAVALQTQFAADDQIDDAVVIVQRDARMLASALLQSQLNGAAGGVGGMDDAPVAVSAFAVQVVIGAALDRRLHRERHPSLAQPADRRRAVFHRELYRVGVAQARAGDHRIVRVGLDRVGGIQHRRDAALRVIGAAFVRGTLSQRDHAGDIGQAQRQT